MTSAARMTDADLLALDNALMSDALNERAMDVCTLQGFATALVIGPRMLLPSVWLPWVWDLEQGKTEPSFADMDEANAVVGQVMRLYSEVATEFAGGACFEPLYWRGEGEWGAAEWCEGFFTAMRLNLADWSPLLVAEPSLFAPFFVLGDPDDLEGLKRRSVEEIEALVEAIVPNVMKIAAHWRAAGAFTAKAPAPIRRDAPKLGRNDACHCGSGLKYKKCHGAN